MTPPPSMPLFILPFDHRTGFAKDIMHVSYPFSKQDRQQAGHLKRLIYQAFLRVREASSDEETFGILLDEETGREVLLEAGEEKIFTAVSTEKSGGSSLSLLYGQETATQLRLLGASCAKVLVRWEHAPEIDDEQIDTLASLQAQLDTADIPLMLELLFSVPFKDRANHITKTINTLREAGIHPAIWKLEGLPSAEDWGQVKKAARAAKLIVLGRGEDEKIVTQHVEIARDSGVVDGFAIGRTIFADAIAQIVQGTMSEDEAVDRIAENFTRFVEKWGE